MDFMANSNKWLVRRPLCFEKENSLKTLTYTRDVGPQKYDQNYNKGAQHTAIVARRPTTTQKGKNDQKAKNDDKNEQKTEVDGGRVLGAEVKFDFKAQNFFTLE